MSDVSYEPFSRESEYVEVNRLFIESLNLAGDSRVLDLACGTGTLTGIICTVLGTRSRANQDDQAGYASSIIGVDISHESLMLAKGYVEAIEASTMRSAHWLEANGKALPLRSNCVDAVIIGNAIQLFDDKDEIVREASRVLVKGGVLAFNTSFYAGTFAPGTERFYLRWVQEALKYIQERDANQRTAGSGKILRKRGVAKAAFSNPWLSRCDYERLLVRHGLEVESVAERTVMLTRRAFEAIGSYAGLACVLLSGYQVELACEALARSVGPALSALRMDVVPRYWIEFISRKKGGHSEEDYFSPRQAMCESVSMIRSRS
jgi:ubiquinone/menaquinone biosynthesis C-methylase UbiE